MTETRKILVTSALPYANGDLHLGNILEFIQTDIWVRFQKLQGNECHYVCGDDAHGTPIMLKAEQLGITPETLISQVKTSHQSDLKHFYIDIDHYHSTHSEENQALCLEFYQHFQSQNDLETHSIEQAYDPKREMFLPDRFVKGQCPNCGAKDQYGDSCDVCGATYSLTELVEPYSVVSGATPIMKTSDHIFFNLKKYEADLKQWANSNHLQTQVANKLNEWFDVGLKPWNISRDAPYFGFEIPNVANKYFYVWLDAPMGYMASFKHLCEQNKSLSFDEFWNKDSQAELYHFVGKDIIYFHALFWPAVLQSAGYRKPNAIWTHGFLTVEGQKMSKSRGTFIQANTFLAHCDPEYLRYYLAAKLTNRVDDIDLNFEDLKLRVNADLVGKIVNIASRLSKILAKNFDNQLADRLFDSPLWDLFIKQKSVIANYYETREFNKAVREIMALADKANQFIDQQQPWKRIKDPSAHQTVQEICTLGLNLYFVLVSYLRPILPKLYEKSEDLFQVKRLSWEHLETSILSQSLTDFSAFMTRITDEQISSLKASLAAPSQAPKATQPTEQTMSLEKAEITIDDFAKIDLRIARITHAQYVEKAEKLLQLEVDLGDVKKQVFAGIKSAYQPESLIGKMTLVLANLKPRRMRFGLSEGMVLVAKGDQEGDLWLLEPGQGAKPGMRVQ